MNFIKFFQDKNIVFFKRWKNKGFAIFNSLKKIVIILTLPIVYLTLSFNFALSQTDTVNLQKITVNSQRKTVNISNEAKLINIITQNEISASASNSFDEIIEGTIGVDVRNRGINSTQADISIRGGNFDQNLILINGVPVSDILTGHNSFDNFIAPAAIERIEILQGAGVRTFGIGAYSGAINFISIKPQKNSFTTNIELGQNNFINISTNLFLKNKNISSILSVNNSYSDGYIANTDFSQKNIYSNLNYNLSKFEAEIQAFILLKNFGAYNFYTPTFPYQYEKIFKTFGSIYFGTKNNDLLKIYLYNKYTTDEFQLFREDEDWYERIGNYWIRKPNDTAKYVTSIYEPWAYYTGANHHLSNISGATISSNFDLFFGKITIGTNIEHNFIRSNVLGEATSDTIIINGIEYLRFAQRTNYNIFSDFSVKFSNFNFSLGHNIIYNTFFNFFNTFGADLKYFVSPHSTLYTSINQGLRLPTYTDLYYNGPSNQGNPNLKPEKSTTYEIGYKIFKKNTFLQSAIFYRYGQNTIDWVKFTDSTKWQTVNYTELHTYGAEIAIYQKFDNKIINFIKLDATVLNQSKPQTEAVSKYTLDYLKYNFSLSSKFSFTKNISLFIRERYSLRNGTYFFLDEERNLLETAYKPVFLVDAKLSYSFAIGKKNKFSLYANVSNLLDVKYYDLSYVILPGRWIKLGISWKLGVDS